ncbi:MAG: hypothetical protein ACR2GQ_02940 [Gemmatimonadota bacterium]|jgi:hypothetical protein
MKLFAIAIAALLPAVPLMSGADQPSRVTDGDVPLELTAVETDYGCRITMKATNNSRSDIWVLNEKSRVRARKKIPTGYAPWGFWSRVPMSNVRVRPGASASITGEFNLGCKAKRQYEFHLKKGSYTATKLYGGSGTTDRTLQLGGLERSF